MNQIDRLYEIICAFDNEIFHLVLGPLGEVQFKFKGVNLARTLDVKEQIENNKPYINVTIATHMFFTHSGDNFVQDFLVEIDRSLFSENFDVIRNNMKVSMLQDPKRFKIDMIQIGEAVLDNI